jgi:hypothetical protein
MFKMQPAPTFRAKVKIPVPGEASGVLEVEFRHKTRKALKAYLEGTKDREDLDALEEIIVGWSGAEVEYSREALATLIDNYAGAAAALVGAYAKELADARLGN